MMQVKTSKVNFNGQFPRGSDFRIINRLCTGFFLISSTFNLMAAVGLVDDDVCEQTADIKITGESQFFWKYFPCEVVVNKGMERLGDRKKGGVVPKKTYKLQVNLLLTPLGRIFFTVRKRSLRRLCFYTCLSVILFMGGCLGPCLGAGGLPRGV